MLADFARPERLFSETAARPQGGLRRNQKPSSRSERDPLLLEQQRALLRVAYWVGIE
jgi:hypothetical protein